MSKTIINDEKRSDEGLYNIITQVLEAVNLEKMSSG